MKNLKLSMIAILAISSSSVVNASSLQEALTNGKISGEVSATYESRNFDKENPGATYYRDSSYGVGSFALGYTTGVWNDLSLTTKIRAYATIFEDDDKADTGTGKGDATSRFYEKDGSTRNIDLEELYLTYAPNSNISIKVGRQAIFTDWINKTHDAIKVDANYGNTSIEAIWSQKDGRVYARDYRPIEKINENKGVYKLGLTQKFNENISATAYGLVMPDMKEIYGARTNLSFNDINARVHYAQSKEDKSIYDDSSLIDIMLSTSIAGFTPYAGYVKVDDNAAFPGYATAFSSDSGEIIVPFEEGDYFYSRGAQTYYLGLSKAFGDLSATLLYGNTEYYAAATGNEKRDVDETTLWLGYDLTKDLSANLGYTIVDEDSKSTVSDYDQVNLTLTYSF